MNSDTSPKPALSTEQKHYRTIWISDVHLGTKDCRADHLNDFLKAHKCDRLYLVGDIIDGWRMKTGIYWTRSYTRIIRRILKVAKQGTPVYYITGNHDEFLRRYANNYLDNLYLVNRYDHITADNRKLLVIHGDQFDSVTRCSKWLRFVGDVGYEFLMFINRAYNRWRARSERGYWSLAGFLKKNIKRAQTYINDYEHAVTHACEKQGYDGVVCGHIHHAANKSINNIAYYNTGDWVESCTAIVEDEHGTIKLIEWLKESPQITQPQKKKTKKKLGKWKPAPQEKQTEVA